MSNILARWNLIGLIFGLKESVEIIVTEVSRRIQLATSRHVDQMNQLFSTCFNPGHDRWTDSQAISTLVCTLVFIEEEIVSPPVRCCLILYVSDVESEKGETTRKQQIPLPPSFSTLLLTKHCSAVAETHKRWRWGIVNSSSTHAAQTKIQFMM